MTEPQNRLAPLTRMAFRVRRILLLTKAIEFLGQERAASALGIKSRSLRAKTEATRGVKDDDLLAAAIGLEHHAAAIILHAKTIRSSVAGQEDASRES